MADLKKILDKNINLLYFKISRALYFSAFAEALKGKSSIKRAFKI